LIATAWPNKKVTLPQRAHFASWKVNNPVSRKRQAVNDTQRLERGDIIKAPNLLKPRAAIPHCPALLP